MFFFSSNYQMVILVCIHLQVKWIFLLTALFSSKSTKIGSPEKSRDATENTNMS